jgi:hypothetical protein
MTDTSSFIQHIQQRSGKPYLFTATFPNPKSNDKPDPQHYLNNYKILYLSLIRLMKIRNNQKQLQPFTYAFFDLPHTSLYKTKNIPNEHFPHIHSIMLIHPDTQHQFNMLIKSPFMLRKVLSRMSADLHNHLLHRGYKPNSIEPEDVYRYMSPIVSIDIRPITNDLPYVVQYASKLMRDPNPEYKYNPDLFMLFPDEPSQKNITLHQQHIINANRASRSQRRHHL